MPDGAKRGYYMLPTSMAGREGGRRRKFLTENETASKRKHVKYSAVRLLLDINWFVEFFNICNNRCFLRN